MRARPAARRALLALLLLARALRLLALLCPLGSPALWGPPALMKHL
jgi:hypothetical protein